MRSSDCSSDVCSSDLRLPSAHFPLKLSRFPTQTQHASVVALSVASEQSCVLETVVNSNSDTERVEWVRGRYTGMEVVTVLARSGSKWDFPCRDFSSCVCQFNEDRKSTCLNSSH